MEALEAGTVEQADNNLQGLANVCGYHPNMETGVIESKDDERLAHVDRKVEEWKREERVSSHAELSAATAPEPVVTPVIPAGPKPKPVFVPRSVYLKTHAAA